MGRDPPPAVGGVAELLEGYGLDTSAWVSLLRSATQYWDAFLDGYTQRRGLGADDLAAVPDFVPATHLWGTSVELFQHVLPRGAAAAQTYLQRRLSYLRSWQV